MPVLARRVPIWRRAVTWIKAHRTTAALVATGLAAAILIASVSVYLRRKEAEFLARRFESAGIAELAELIPRVNVTDPDVVGWLGRLYDAGKPEQKLAAALVLAPTRGACEEYVIDQFLSSDPRLLGLLTPLVSRRSLGRSSAGSRPKSKAYRLGACLLARPSCVTGRARTRRAP